MALHSRPTGSRACVPARGRVARLRDRTLACLTSIVAASPIACGGDSSSGAASDADGGTGGMSAGTAGADGSGTTGAATGTAPDTTNAVDDTGPHFDFGVARDAEQDTPPPSCHDFVDIDPIPDCEYQAPADSFEPEVQWSWGGQGSELYAMATPLVANLTDDNADGMIDLCDIPDVVVVAFHDGSPDGAAGHIYVLDGATGAVHFQIPTAVEAFTCPAVGDIDGDGLPEIVTADANHRLIAFEHDGALAWQTGHEWRAARFGSIALADFDADGDVEILAGTWIHDHTGAIAVVGNETTAYFASTAADLDDDGDLEIVLGHEVRDHDGAQQWIAPIGGGFPQVANLDDDDDPEILVTTTSGVALLEHDGEVIFQNLTPAGHPGDTTLSRAGAVADFDGDGQAEFAVGSANEYIVYETDTSVVWSGAVADHSGIAGATAFDFLGDGQPEGVFADEDDLFVFAAGGDVLVQTARTSLTGTEYPVVVDVDNDGAAEILVVSSRVGTPTLQVIRDVDERWAPARRIWNQHTYHVTNVREDGTIPQHEPKSWLQLNTFRTNAQVEGGSVCRAPQG